MKGLLVDDDALYLRVLQRTLQRHGMTCTIADDQASALRAAGEEDFDFALLDLKLEHSSGLSLIDPLRRMHPRMRILMISGYASIATAVEAIKLGADDYLAKPVAVESLLRALKGDGEPVAAPLEDGGMIPLHRLEWEHIQRALQETDGNVSAAARLLGMHRRSLQRKLAKKPGQERRSVDE
jgi:two-component system response regulator RegA